eukprot:8349-Heterococcus_DN1.PRE.1
MLTHVILAAIASLQAAVRVLASPSLSTRGRVPRYFAARYTSTVTAIAAVAAATTAAGVATSTYDKV